jgi:diguanylate cyclase (GGDEF)-like protein
MPDGGNNEGAQSKPPALPPTGEGELPGAKREALLRIAAAAAENDLSPVIEVAAEEALSEIGAASITVSRFEDEGRIYRALINVGQLADWEVRLPEDETYSLADYPRLRRLWETGEINFSSLDDPNCDPASAELLRSVGKTADLEVPVIVEGEIWGGIWAASADTSFCEEDIRFLEAVAGQLGNAVARFNLFAKVSRMAYEDGLTGLANRRALDERLERACARVVAGESSLSVMLCDVDGLKVINDSNGHEAGDQALSSVARALLTAATAHPSAFVARGGGDEFCVLLETARSADEAPDGAPIEDLGASAQRLLRLDSDVTISCGVAIAGPQTSTPSELLRAADSAQYTAKRRGGNRLCIAGDLDRTTVTPQRRGSASERLAAAAIDVAAELEGRLAQAPALDRLELVGWKLAAAAGFPYWTISIAEAGTDVIHDVSIGDLRQAHGEGMIVARAHDDLNSYPLDEFPATAKLVELGTGSFVAAVDDPDSDASERRLLEKEGYQGVVGAVAGTEEGVYLLELFSEGVGAPLQLVSAVLTLAVSAAMPPAPHLRAPGGREQGHELSLTLAGQLSGATSAGEICDAAVEQIHRAFGCALTQIIELVDDAVEVRAEAGEFLSGSEWSQSSKVGLIGQALREQVPVLVRDVSREPQYRAASGDVRSELAVAIPVDGKPWGVINLEDVEAGAFSEGDARLLESVAAQVGAALTAIALYQRLDRAYLGTAEALSKALEAKHSYTAEHSRSISETAVDVGEQMGLEGEDLMMLRYAGSFHDIGKVAISREVLDKPGPLNDREWAEIVEHTKIGEQILGPIEFLAPIRSIVRSAHERWDGEGYPDGLAADAIPLAARILFACDVYDAMTTDRPYSAAVSDADARAELEHCAGSQLDPKVVQALLEVLERRYGPVESGDAPEKCDATGRDRQHA